MEAVNKTLVTIKELIASRTIWGMLILLANTFFAGKVDTAALQELPTTATAAIDQMQGTLAAIGAAMVVIGRVFAKPTALAK